MFPSPSTRLLFSRTCISILRIRHSFLILDLELHLMLCTSLWLLLQQHNNLSLANAHLISHVLVAPYFNEATTYSSSTLSSFLTSLLYLLWPYCLIQPPLRDETGAPPPPSISPLGFESWPYSHLLPPFFIDILHLVLFSTLETIECLGLRIVLIISS